MTFVRLEVMLRNTYWKFNAPKGTTFMPPPDILFFDFLVLVPLPTSIGYAFSINMLAHRFAAWD